MAASKAVIPPLVLVEWEDAARLDDTTWAVNTPITKSEAVLFQTIGFLLHADEDRIIVTGSWSPDTIGPRDQIPRGMVRKISRLGVKR